MKTNNKYVDVGLTEEFILNYSALPTQLDGWRYHRIEYGGCNESCFMERPIYLPRFANSYVIEMLFDYWQTKGNKAKRKKLHRIIMELEEDLG
jgi:hypothetical protein